MSTISSSPSPCHWVWRTLWSAAFTLSITIAVLAIVQAAIGMPRSRGVFASPNTLGYYAVAHVFLGWALRRELPRLGPLAAIFAAAAVGLSGSRASLLALAAGVIFLYRLPRWLGFAAAGAVALALIAVNHGIEPPRWAYWKLGLKIWLQHPWWGWGSSIMVPGVPAFYNVAIDELVKGGVAGFAPAALFLVVLWRWADHRMRAFLVAWLTNGMFMFATPAATLPLAGAALWILLERRHVAREALRVDEDQPLLHGRVRPVRPDGGEAGVDGVVGLP